MSKPEYPSGADVEQVIEGLRLFDVADLAEVFEFIDTDALALAAVHQWETETGWIPFLADVDDDNPDQTRYFDPPGPNSRGESIGGGNHLILDCGIVELVTVHTGWSPTFAGTAALAGTDFRLWPYNADPLDRPWTELRFKVPQWGQPQSIKIVGRFGYAATVREDVWLAILHQGVTLALPEVATRVTGGMVEWKEADASERYGEAFLFGDKGVGSAWGLEWSRTVNRYRRVVI